jgi:hypothetical protein
MPARLPKAVLDLAPTDDLAIHKGDKTRAVSPEQATIEVEGLVSGWHFGERDEPPLSRDGVDRFAQLLEMSLCKWDDCCTHDGWRVK